MGGRDCGVIHGMHAVFTPKGAWVEEASSSPPETQVSPQETWLLWERSVVHAAGGAVAHAGFQVCWRVRGEDVDVIVVSFFLLSSNTSRFGFEESGERMSVSFC